MYDFYKKIKDALYKVDAREYNSVDCYGICYLFNLHIGKHIPKFASIQSDKDRFIKVNLGKEMPGDIILFNIKGFPIHVACVVQKGAMLHIMENSNVELENYNNIKWKRRLVQIYRYESSYSI